jgi:ketosteroid isomerase-like protein
VTGKAEAQRRKVYLKTAKAFETCRRTLRMFVYQGRPEVARTSANRRF